MPAAKFQIIRKCPICGSEFMAKTIESLYCSPKCSKIAWKRKHDDMLKQAKMDEAVKNIPESKDMITVPEAYLLFGISKETIYRQIQKGNITGVNAGKRMTLVSKSDLMKKYPLRPKATDVPKKPAKVFRLEPEDCYTIGEVGQKYKLDDSTVYLHVRKYSIPTRQIGNYVYVPKSEIDELYKGMKI